MSIASQLADLAIDAARIHFLQKLDEKKLHDEMVAYIESQRKYNYFSTHEEEIDFQGLVEYIDNELLNEVTTRLFSPDKKVRRKANDFIIESAIRHSKAEKSEAKKRVATIMSIVLEIIRKFFHSKIDIKCFILADEIVDAVCENDKQNKEEIIREIDQSKEEIIRANEFSVDKFMELSERGDYKAIDDRFHILAESINHPLSPDFGFDRNLNSIPRTPNAYINHPPKILCTGTITIGGKPITEISDNPDNYAYRHQLPIVFNIESAKQYLGNFEEFKQEEAKKLIGTHTQKPKEFPPAQPFKIIADGTVVFEYVELRLREILDDGTNIIDNHEQNKSYLITIQINIEVSKQNASWSIHMDANATNKESLSYLLLTKAASEGKIVEIVSLKKEDCLVSGRFSQIQYQSGFSNIDEEIDFRKRVCEIEEYYKNPIRIPQRISVQDYNVVKYFSELINGNYTTGDLAEHTFRCIVNDEFKANIEAYDEEFRELIYVGSVTGNIFGNDITIPIQRRIVHARIKDFERLKKKIEYADNGEEIMLTLDCGNDCRFYDSIVTEQDKESLNLDAHSIVIEKSE